MFFRCFLRGVCVLHSLFSHQQSTRFEPTQAGPFADGKARKAYAWLTCYDISSDQATVAVRSRSVHREGAPRAVADEAFSGSGRSFRRSTQDSTALHETAKFRVVQLISDVICFDRAATMWRRIGHWWF